MGEYLMQQLYFHELKWRMVSEWVYKGRLYFLKCCLQRIVILSSWRFRRNSEILPCCFLDLCFKESSGFGSYLVVSLIGVLKSPADLDWGTLRFVSSKPTNFMSQVKITSPKTIMGLQRAVTGGWPTPGCKPVYKLRTSVCSNAD